MYQVAAPARPKIKPAFVVQKLEGKTKHTILGFDSKGKRTSTVVEEDAGYLVSFPTKGHSIRVRNDAELKRMGFDQTIPLVDEEGDVMGVMPNVAMKGE